MSSFYIDTSVLVKAYVREASSDTVLSWMAGRRGLSISLLSVVELHCAMNRRVRAGLLDTQGRREVLAQFDEETTDERFHVLAWPVSAFVSAGSLFESVGNVPLRALDALHLSVARHHRCTDFATADRIQSEAANLLGFSVHTFFPNR